MTNPFAEPDGSYVVLANDEEQHSLWPADTPVPAGWRVVRRPDSYRASLDHITGAWSDLRPKSLKDAAGRGTR